MSPITTLHFGSAHHTNDYLAIWVNPALSGRDNAGSRYDNESECFDGIVPEPTDYLNASDWDVYCGDYRMDFHMRQSPASSPAPLEAVSRDFLNAESLPERLEPDKNCHLHNRKPKRHEIADNVTSDYLRLFDPERAMAIDDVVKENGQSGG